MPASISHKILRNTSFNILSRAGHTIVYILIIPVIINHIGATRYGFWVVFFAFADYFSLMDLGFGAATIKYTADRYAQNDIFGIGQIINTTFSFYLLLIPLVGVPIIFSKEIVQFFQISPDYLDEALFVLRGVLVIFLFSLLTSVFRNILIGLQRMDIQNLCEVANTILYAAGTVVVLKSGWGLKGLIVLIGVLRLVLVATHAICVFYIIPKIRTGLFHFNKTVFKDFFRYGIKLQLTSVAGLFNFQLDKLLIGHFLRIDLVTFYELGSKIAMFIRNLPLMLLGPLIPASAELSAVNDRVRLEAMYIRGSRYITMISAPIACFLSAAAPSVLALWMGSTGHPDAVLAVRFLAVGYFLNIITGVTASMGRGIGVLNYEMYSSGLISVSNLGLSLVLIIKMGYVGALIGTSATMVVGNVVLLYKFNQYMEIRFGRFLKDTFVKPVLMAIAAGGLVWLGQQLICEPVAACVGRVNIALFLIAAGVVFVMAYGGGLYAWGFINKSDLDILKQVQRSIWRVNGKEF